MTPRTDQPFCFYTRLSLTFLTGIKAKNIQELLDYLKIAPPSVIYQHTHHFMEEHNNLVPEPPNDFSWWITHMLQDEILGERLAAIDTTQFKSLSNLQQALVSCIEDHLKINRVLRQSPDGKEFHFMRTLRFSVPTPYRARDYSEFLECLKKVSSSSLYLHIFEAKLRSSLGINDFSHWFETELGEKSMAALIATPNLRSQTLNGLRLNIIGLVEKRIKELTHV
ncbi:MAG: hypothetical protein HY200_02115 [Nitrospirae bacterium]|nr:hypothetical protein [Nitrospirota bacterium]MBI3593732.1 hypothetical protein [Nitrospirota bacterium]